jgi:hypothetical protein
MGHHKGQDNNQKGWIYMFLYWGVSHLVGLREGYFERFCWSSITPWHGLALLVTIECQRRFNTRLDRFGRKPDYVATIVFTVANSIYETLAFLFVYDFGRKHLSEMYSLSRGTGIGVGFTCYYFYSALIHVLFWLPLVFPKHTKPKAPPFHKHGLPLLTIMSIAWFGIYEVYEDIAFVCALHAIVDGWGGFNMGLQGPFATAGKGQATVKAKDL